MKPKNEPENVQAENSSATKPDQSATKLVRADSLAEFLQIKGAKPGHFVVDINKGVVRLPQEDIVAAAALLGTKPALLGRVLELARAAVARGGLAKDTIMRLSLLTIQHQALELREWPGDDSTHSAFANLAGWARPRLRAKTREMTLRAEHVLSLGIIFLIEQRVVDPTLILRDLANSFRPPSSDGAREASRNVVKLLQKARPAQLAQFAEIANLQASVVEEALRKADRERQTADTLRVRIDELQLKEASLQEDLADARKEIEVYARQIEQLRRELESARRMGSHDLGDLRARYKRVFAEELEPVANDAIDALELNKPEFAHDFLGSLRKRIAEEVMWLNSSSE